MYFETKRARPSSETQSRSRSHSGKKPRDPQERESPDASLGEQRSAEQGQTQIEPAGRQGLFSFGCERFRQIPDAPDTRALALCQRSFFVCTVKKFGNLPGAGRIYVETIVECGSGAAFAKVYSQTSAMNAVDILRSRAMPYFQRRGREVTAVHTPGTAEYCGLDSIHPFEAFLSTSHIRHFPLDDACPHCRQRSERFYRLLLKDFFVPALRRSFRLSLSALQKDLDTFVESHNARQRWEEQKAEENSGPSANFSVHP